MNHTPYSSGDLARSSNEPSDLLAAGSGGTHQVVPVPRGPAPRVPTVGTSAPNAMGIIRALRRRQTLALGIALLAACISAPAAWFLVPPAKYKAQAKLQLVATPPKVLFRTVETEGSGEDYKRYQNTQLTLVKSQLVINAALMDKGVSKYSLIQEQNDPVTWLQNQLKIEFVSGSEVMEISLSGDKPTELAGIVNAVKKAYMEEVVNVEVKRRSDRHQMLRKIRDDYGRILDEKRLQLRRNAETVGSDDKETLAKRQQYAWEHVAWLRKELADIQSQKRRFEAQIKARRPAEETVAAAPTEDDINQLIDQSAIVANLLARLDRDEAAYDTHFRNMRMAARTGDPHLKVLRDAVTETRKLLKKQRAELRPIAIRQLQEQSKGHQVIEVDQEQQDLAIVNEIEERLNTEIKTVSDGNRSLNVQSLDLQSLQEEVAQMQGTASQVGAEVEALNVELQAPPRVRTIEDAVPPRSRDESKRLAMIGLIIAGSFAGGLFGVAFLELQTQKVDTTDVVPVELGLQIVGTLPIMRSRSARAGAMVRSQRPKDRYWHNVLLESIDATRTMLVHAARTESHRVVMITSAVGGEGKTSLSSHLATSLARSGLRTLLIDADLRSPSIHRIFDLPLSTGLSELLRGEVDLSGAIAHTDIADLKIVTAGRCDRQTIRLLSQGYIGPLFSRFKEQFDFVIVDSSPVLPVADAAIIAQQADAVLFSIFSDVTRKANVCAALGRLQSLGVRILGAVVMASFGGGYGTDYHSDAYYGSLPDSAAESSSDQNA